MPFQCTSLISTPLTNVNVADCQALAKLSAELLAEANDSATMPAARLDAEVITIFDALKRRQNAKDKAKEALAKNNRKLALDAIGAVVDISVEVCVMSRNPLCIGSAYGVKVLYDTTSLGIQLYDARTPTQAAEVVVAFSDKRIALFTGVVDAVKPKTPVESAKRAIEASVRVAQTLSESAADVAAAKADLQAAVSELDTLQALYDKVLINTDSYRKHRAEVFQARRFLLGVLSAGYAAQGCRVNALPPLP